MMFNSVEDADTFYRMYSRCIDKKGITRYRKWHCNKEGYCSEKWLEKEDRERNHKTETRVKCGACLRIKYNVKQEKYIVNEMLVYETRVQRSAIKSHVQVYGYGAYAVNSLAF
ncbi:hypothetical protein M9H77_04453 [Catharanthus roseus]|uniref:Uncharacterized protein n=1 Tax=Catharanthus roseus TaxID=4058 RepID=A0ACC0CE67_CATRO|nr:hypothetical protein M9H77_04453 [Catharanthus roseus]